LEFVVRNLFRRRSTAQDVQLAPIDALIKEYVEKFDRRNWPDVTVRTSDFLERYPNDTILLIEGIIRGIPDCGTALRDLVDRLTEDEFGRMVDIALDQYALAPSPSAEKAVHLANERSIASLYPRLERVFQSRINQTCYYGLWPFRGATALDTLFLRPIVDNATLPAEARTRAWRALVETRDPDCLRYALSIASTVPLPKPVDDYLQRIGFEREGGVVRQLYPSTVYTILFDDKHSDLAPLDGHDTVFGGVCTSGHCLACGSALDRVLTLDRVPEGLGVSGLSTLSLATCLQCLGWEIERFFYRHGVDGEPTHIAYDGGHVEPQFPTDPFDVRLVRLASTPSGRKWDNVTRLGGFPNWEQEPEFLSCPECSRTMPFLLQVTSGHANGSNSCVEFGDGGLAYVSWCDGCRISGWTWQCT